MQQYNKESITPSSMLTQTVEPAILTKFTPELSRNFIVFNYRCYLRDGEGHFFLFSMFRVLSMERELKQHVDHLPADFNRINVVRAIPEL